MLDDVVSKMMRFSFVDGKWVDEAVDIEGLGSITLGSSSDESNIFFFTYEDFLTPDTLYVADDGGRTVEALRSLPEFFDSDGMSVEQHFATSKDGTRVPYFVVLPKGFEADGTTPVSAALVDGTDYTATFDGAPNCTLTFNFLTPDAALGADQRLLVTYDAALDADTQENAALTNVAGATEWFSLDVSDANNTTYARTYARAVTDGTVGTLDHEDAHTTTIFTPVFMFEKTAANVTTGDDPTTTAAPGDTIRYTLRIENVNGTSISNLSVVDELDSLNASLESVSITDLADQTFYAVLAIRDTDGEIVEVNEAIVEDPGKVNEDPLGDAWFFKIKPSDLSPMDDYMDEAAYKDFIG